jgi:hypothetical protein
MDSGYVFDYMPFTGIFDGQGHIIKKLTITGEYYNSLVGLFSSVWNATIKNVGFVETNIVIDTHGNHGITGSICGEASSSFIDNCYSQGRVTFTDTYSFSEYSYVGGIVGHAYSTKISNCTNFSAVSSAVKGRSIVGGICGYASSEFINSNNFGNVFASSDQQDEYGWSIAYAAGICGEDYRSSVNECYNNGDITAEVVWRHMQSCIRDHGKQLL